MFFIHQIMFPSVNYYNSLGKACDAKENTKHQKKSAGEILILAGILINFINLFMNGT